MRNRLSFSQYGIMVALLAAATAGSSFSYETAARFPGATRALSTDSFVDGTVRLRTRTIDNFSMCKTGWGAAFSVDLSAYGLRGSRYLLTAAHLIDIYNGKIMPRGELEIEVGKNLWAPCKVIALDVHRDLCLLESSVRMPVMSKLCSVEDIRFVGEVGEGVVIVGCPKGVPPCISRGILTDKDPAVAGVRWQAAAQFNHGNSGGPVYDAKTGKVIGVAVAGISDGFGDMRPDTALFAPFTEVRSFLDVAIATHAIGSHQKTIARRN